MKQFLADEVYELSNRTRELQKEIEYLDEQVKILKRQNITLTAGLCANIVIIFAVIVTFMFM